MRSEKNMKVLIIKPSSFGDIVQALPCADALKNSFEDIKITWIVFNQWKGIVELCPDVDEVIAWDRKGGVKEFFRLVGLLRKTHFDCVFDLQGLLRSALLARLIKARKKIGVSGMKELSCLLIKEALPQNARINASLRNLETIRFITQKTLTPKASIKIDSQTMSQALQILSDAGIFGDFIVLQPFARGAGKDWSVQNYLELIDLIKSSEPKMNIVVLGMENNFGKLGDRVFDLCGKTNLKQLAAILSKSKAAIGADTGSMHLAAIMEIPSIFIFGASDINETAPLIGKFSLLINEHSPKNINAITPQQVFKKYKENGN